jgi:hypothetical protein
MPPTAIALPFAPTIDLTTASAPVLLDAWLAATDAPSEASAFAMATPIPLEAPLTMEILSVSLLMIIASMPSIRKADPGLTNLDQCCDPVI